MCPKPAWMLPGLPGETPLSSSAAGWLLPARRSWHIPNHTLDGGPYTQATKLDYKQHWPERGLVDMPVVQRGVPVRAANCNH